MFGPTATMTSTARLSMSWRRRACSDDLASEAGIRHHETGATLGIE